MLRSRRSALRFFATSLAGGAFVGAAGCLDRDRGPIERSLDENVRVEDGQFVSVEGLWTQSAICYGADGGRLLAEPGYQYVFAQIPADPPSEQFDLVLDGTEYGGGLDISLAAARVEPPERIVVDESDRSPADIEFRKSLVGFRVPRSVRPSEAVVRWSRRDGPRVDWRVPSDHPLLERLESPPTFAVERFDAPASVPDGEFVPVSVAFERTGGREEPFRAVISSPDAPAVHLVLDAPTGKRVRWEGELGYRVGTDEATYRLRWRGGLSDVTVRIR